ncbi:hypothetical protein NQ318_006923 [Aromia moschata]|uniref:Uncharacterized protein n=1 Tax=Aromia moschata TaxID=1265417 RepID=A0AAV8YNR5_9CUCU|nr:hypothetical protein NQ318_006923 [Aromia moschata]
MLAETSKKYANITKERYASIYLCVVYVNKRKQRKRGLVSKPILHSEMNSRCQVDLIDFQTQPDRNFKFIWFTDHLTKFSAVYSYELASLWQNSKLCTENLGQSKTTIPRNGRGLEICTIHEKPRLPSGIKQSPYKALFGIEPRVGLSTSSLPQEIINNIQDEDDLKNDCNVNLTENSDDNAEDNADKDEGSSAGNDIQKARKTAAENLIKQAKKMKTFLTNPIHHQCRR